MIRIHSRVFGQASIMFILFYVCIIECAMVEIQAESNKQSVDSMETKLAFNLSKNCNKAYSVLCLKLDVASFVDKLSEETNIELGILPGVSIVKESGSNEISSLEMVAHLAREFPDDVDKRLDAYLVQKVGNYLKNHAVSIKLFDPKSLVSKNSTYERKTNKYGIIEARKKDKGGMGGMMAGLMMMKGTLGALGFGALAMLAGKALMTGLMALMLSSIVGLKSLAGGHSAKTTYEIVSKPVYTTAHTHSSEEVHGHGYGSSSYGRSIDEVHETVQEAVRKYGNVLNRRSIL